ncbi:hypothetical protein [Flavobacterium sp. 3HN19-14]|uniref:hypothetical protein n=1 Tax=Flavobacterium sp. 3HN19-14 TaxID=3448133 RepID=UPI003EE30D6C
MQFSGIQIFVAFEAITLPGLKTCNSLRLFSAILSIEIAAVEDGDFSIFRTRFDSLILDLTLKCEVYPICTASGVTTTQLTEMSEGAFVIAVFFCTSVNRGCMTDC